MSIVEDQRVLSLHQAGRLQLRKPVETLLVDANAEAARQQRRGVLQHAGIGCVEAANDGQVALESRAIERRLIQILRGAHECAGAAAHGVDERFEIAAGFGRQEDQCLLCTVGNGDGETFVCAGALPRGAAEKPVLRRRIGRAAQEGDDQQIVLGLRRREIGFDRELVARGQMRRLRDGQRGVAS